MTWLFSRENIWDKRSAKLLVDMSMQAERTFVLRARDTQSWTGALWKIFSWLIYIVTFGQQWILNNRFYMAMGTTIWCPGTGDAFKTMSARTRYTLIAHECHHFSHRYLGDPDAIHREKLVLTAQPTSWLPPIKTARAPSWWWVATFNLRYMLFPFPVVFCTFRRNAEYHAYKRNMFVYIADIMRDCQRITEKEEFLEKLHQDESFQRDFRWIVEILSSSSYGWMFSASRAEDAVRGMMEEGWELYSLGELNSLCEAYNE
ncbi:MAG: hypothetical protein KDA17_08320 [Candidatus Saccharibacteria bacterium]|nr:hypothetical protein [Candidatus Saccharibacteria bacterium]